LQVLTWGEEMTGRSGVARALQNLFIALQGAAAASGMVGGGGAPVAVNPSELREALAALPSQLFCLGE